MQTTWNATVLTRIAVAVACLALFALPLPAMGMMVLDVTASDVTTRAFSVVWVLDELVNDATVRVFAEPAGTTELTGGLTITLEASPAALALGVVKVDVTGLAPDTCYYFQTETTGTAMVQSPAAPPFTEVCTALSTSKAGGSLAPIINDLIAVDLFQPDGTTAADGALLVLSVPAVGAYPISSFAGANLPLPAAAVDLGNLFDPVGGDSAQPATDDVMLIRQFRGLHCSNLQNHQLVQYRRVPAHDEIPGLGQPITEVETGTDCFFADTECDDTIDILDAQRVLNVFASQSGDCAFNPDLDIVPDQTINVLDVQSVLNRFGESAPFN